MTAVIQESGTIKIPSSILDELDLTPGTRVSLEVEGHKFVIRKVSPEVPHWKELRGMLRDENYKDGDIFEDLKRERAEERERDEERLRRLR